MHPDCVVMERLDVSSPRLDQTELESYGSRFQNYLRAEMETDDDLAAQEKGQHSMLGSSKFTGSNEDSIASSNIHIDDEESLFSNDSNLSVGQENFCKTNTGNQFSSSDSFNQNLNKLKAFKHLPKLDDSPADNNISNDILEDNARQAVLPSDIINSFAVAKVLQNPPLPTTIQEVFLKNSNFYAEEIMKHQIKLMTGAINMTGNAPLLNTTPMEFPSKFGLCNPFVLQAKSTESSHLTKIQSHLNAITHLGAAAAAAAAAAVAANTTAQNMPRTHSDITKSDSFNIMSKSQSSRNSIGVESPLQCMNDNNESALKFSIDNILKADFGKKGENCSSDGYAENNSTKDKDKIQRNRSRKHNVPADRKQNNASKSISNKSDSSKIFDFSSSLASICSKQKSVFGCLDKNSCEKLDGTMNRQRIDSASELHNETTKTAEELDGITTSSKNLNPDSSDATSDTTNNEKGPIVWPAWVYCTRYSDRPSSGRSPRARKPKKSSSEKGVPAAVVEDKRPRTAFSGSQLARLKHEFHENRYLTEKRRQQLSSELGLNEAQIKIWFQNKRAKLKKSSGTKNPLALQLMAQGLYNHTTVPLTREEEELQERQQREMAENM